MDSDQLTINVIANQAIENYQLKVQVGQLTRALEKANAKEKEREQAVPETGDEGTSQAQEEKEE